MKTIYRTALLCAVALWAGTAPLKAQDEADKELTRQMTLEREYDPSVQDANKINTLPVVKEPEIRKVPIDYALSVFPGAIPKELSTLPSGKVMTEINYNPRRGYLNLAGGTFLNLNGDFGYHLLSTEKDRLGIFASHRSANGKVEYIQHDIEGIDPTVKAKLNDNLGGLHYTHRAEKIALKLGAKYGYSAYNYYGYPVNSTSLGSIQPENIDRETEQVNQTIQVIVGVASVDNSLFNYLLDVHYTNFSQKYGLLPSQDGITEHAVGAVFDFSAPLATGQKVGLQGNVNHYSYSLPTGLTNYDSRLTATVSPYYMLGGDSWQVKLGVNAMLITGNGNTVFASPNITANVEVAPKTVFYLNALGEVQANSLHELTAINRYLSPNASALASRTWLDGTIGLRSGSAPGFWFDIFAGYKATEDDYFHVLPLSPPTNGGFGNMSLLQPSATKRLQVGVGLKYDYRKMAEISLKGVYNHWTVSDYEGNTGPDNKAYGRPEMEWNAGITLRPVNRLSILLDYYLATGRYIYWANKEPERMNNINELNLTALYTLNNTFGAYVKATNLLAQKYEMVYGYPMQGIGVMAGININF